LVLFLTENTLFNSKSKRVFFLSKKA